MIPLSCGQKLTSHQVFNPCTCAGRDCSVPTVMATRTAPEQATELSGGRRKRASARKLYLEGRCKTMRGVPMHRLVKHVERCTVGRRQFAACRASILVVAEHDNSSLSPASLSAVTAAGELKGDVTLLVIGHQAEPVAEQASKVAGVTKVLHAEDAAYTKWVAENITKAVSAVQHAGSYTHVVALSTMAGKNFIGRLAAEFDCAPVTDVLRVIDEDTFVRPMYAGNAVATVIATSPVRFLTVRPTAFEKAGPSSGSAPIESFTASTGSADAGLASFVSESVSKGDRPDLTAARVVVSGGRGLKDGKNFTILEKLADKLRGAVGASRAAVDAGFVPNELQVGQTGKVVAPDLYIAVGISGAIQHLSGMKDSKCIVAINKDKDAPIFQAADYGLVADLFEVVPELESKL